MARDAGATVDRILEGALAVLARSGPRKLSISDVCQEAAVARGTLYRYFASKDELLDAVARYVGRGAESRLALAIERQPDPAQRVEVVFDVITRFDWLHPGHRQILEHEPRFALAYIRDVFPHFVDLAAAALEPAADLIPTVRDGQLTVRDVAEIALRAGASTVYLPADDAERLTQAMMAMVGAGSYAARR